MIIWLASYPKSGNTWLRAFLSYYCYGKVGEFNFKLLENIKKFPDIKDLKDLNINYLDTSELIKNWSPLQDYINLKKEMTFLKTHNALCTINNYSFANSKSSIGAIYILRDPRDVIISLSNHFNKTLGETLEIMLSDSFWETETKFENFHSSIFGSWANNYRSWKNTNIFDSLIIRYEDMIQDPFNTFSKIIKYIEKKTTISFDEALIRKTIELTSFKNLQNKENIGEFKEAAHGIFFRRGEINQWKKNLPNKIIKKLEDSFSDVMFENKYLL